MQCVGVAGRRAHHDIQDEEHQRAGPNGDTYGRPENGLDRGTDAVFHSCNRAHGPEILTHVCGVFKEAGRSGDSRGVCVGAPSARRGARQARFAVAAPSASRHQASTRGASTSASSASLQLARPFVAIGGENYGTRVELCSGKFTQTSRAFPTKRRVIHLYMSVRPCALTEDLHLGTGCPAPSCSLFSLASPANIRQCRAGNAARRARPARRS